MLADCLRAIPPSGRGTNTERMNRMEALKIEGKARLSGCVSTSGSKNASLPLMAAALLTRSPCLLRNVPHLADVSTLSRLLEKLGCSVVRQANDDLQIVVEDEHCTRADRRLVRNMRASVCVMGPLLARRGSVRVPLPGGCRIGFRPIDIHLRGLAALGADVSLTSGDVVLTAQQLKAAQVDLSGKFGPTVTGTCNVLSAAVLAPGHSRLTSAAVEPEVVELAEFLNRMGARIRGHGTSVIEVEGVDALHGTDWTVSQDRIEAATLMLAAAITRSCFDIVGVPLETTQSVRELLQQVGVRFELHADGRLCVDGRRATQSVRAVARPYPALPTDVQAQFLSLMATLEGASSMTDSVFPERFVHCQELAKMGAQLSQVNSTVHVTGPVQLCGAQLNATDLRAAAALVLAALAATGESVIHNIHHLDRGYEALDEKLAALGARIQRRSAPHPKTISNEATARRSA